MKITDLMILLVIFGIGMTSIGFFMAGLEAQYDTSNYTQTYNEGEYEYLISEQGKLADDGTGLAESNTELGTGGTSTDPYRNIFVGGWNAIKSLVGVGSDIETLQADLQVSTKESGLQIPGFVWAALAAIAAIVFVAALINASQRVSV